LRWSNKRINIAICNCCKESKKKSGGTHVIDYVDDEEDIILYNYEVDCNGKKRPWLVTSPSLPAINESSIIIILD